MFESFKLEKKAVLFLLFHSVLWFAVGLILDVHPDMADHWVWSQTLAFGYYEHPPFVALTMLPTNWFGNAVVALKLGSALFSSLIFYLAYVLGKELFNEKTAFTYLLILESTLYFSFGSVFWHIDQPYMAFWLLGLLVIAKWAKAENPNWMLAFGAVAGFGAVSKYIMVLFPLSMFFWLAVCPKSRKLPKQWQTYAGALLAMAILAPNIYWNYTHEWVTFVYNFQKGLTGAEPLKQFSIFQAGQLFLFSIVMSGAFWVLLALKKISSWTEVEGGNAAVLFLKVSGLIPLLFFSYTSFLGRGSDPHWLNIAYFSFFLFLAHHLTHEGSHYRAKLLVPAFVINGILVVLVIWQVLANPLDLSPDQNKIFAKVNGWPEVSEAASGRLTDYGLTMPDFTITREYQFGGVLALYLEGHPLSHSIEKPIRNDWSHVETLKKTGALLFCPPAECRVTLKKAKARFESNFDDLGSIQVVKHGVTLHDLQLYYLRPVQ
ncbi:MAG: glycosyltransferase family 39 protein [SAR324 cluster bacterium]|nr:glycosyltransferase family 39 protein [SAR324 cluster bacterium]